MKQQITTALDHTEVERIDKILGDRTRYEFARDAIREKLQREEGANR